MNKNLLVISPYPARNTTHNGGGIASYTKNTILAIKRTAPNQKIVVLANIIDKKETYLENGILVIRCWQRNSPWLFPTLVKQVLRFRQIKNILFEFEFAAYGDLAITAFVIPLLAFLKLTDKHTVSIIHQAVPNLKTLATHAGLENKPKITTLLNWLLKIFYISLIGLSNSVITLEETLANRLNQICATDKITVIPHGLYPQKTHNQILAKKRLSLNPKDLHVLAFGYLSHYKGSDIAVDAFKQTIEVNGREVKLILAGGESPTQGQKNHYQGFYKKLYELIDNKANVIHTGFVPDSRIKTYFSAADLVIFPYRTMMSASGPLSLAVAFNKPFLVSDSLGSYSDYSFKANPRQLKKMIISTLGDKKIQKQLQNITANLQCERNFNSQGKTYLETINGAGAKLNLWPRTSPNLNTASFPAVS